MDAVEATVRLTNTGARPTVETVQAYISDLTTSVTWAEQELEAFTQVELAPGQTREVPIAVPASRCTLVDAAGHRTANPARSNSGWDRAPGEASTWSPGSSSTTARDRDVEVVNFSRDPRKDTMTDGSRLVADLGGTDSRFALADPDTGTITSAGGCTAARLPTAL